MSCACCERRAVCGVLAHDRGTPRGVGWWLWCVLRLARLSCSVCTRRRVRGLGAQECLVAAQAFSSSLCC